MNLISGYRVMWTLVMFDLPVTTAEARRAYTRFRKSLLEQGFVMLQYSVYARCNDSEEKAETIADRVRSNLPPKGQIRLLQLTDKQFGRMQVFFGKMSQPTEEPYEQLEFF